MYSARAVARLNSSNGTLIWDDVIAISYNGKGNQKENIRPEFDASLNRTKEMRKSEWKKKYTAAILNTDFEILCHIWMEVMWIYECGCFA